MLWTVARGGSEKKRSMAAKMRLHVYICPTEYMDESSVTELYKFLSTLLDSSMTIQEFHKVLLSYSYAVIYRERRDGSLRGIFLMSLEKMKHEGKYFTLLRLGLSFIEKEYRGGPYIHYVFSYFRIMEFLRHPFTPFYVFGKVFGYRGYATLCNNFRHIYPGYKQETPDHIKKIISEFAMKLKMPNEEYDSDNCVLKREYVHMKNFVSEPGRIDIKDPNVEFFIKTNPGWKKGHQLITLSIVDLGDIMLIVYKMLVKVLTGSTRRDKGKKKPKLLRRMTFQSDLANESIGKIFSECDVTGHHHPSVSSDMEDLDDAF